MEIEKNRFKKLFPSIAEELDAEEQKIEINSTKSDFKKIKKGFSRQFAGYVPDVIDFIRRCDNEQQADEIIKYLENKTEIDCEYAMRLRRQLKEKGVRSFGPKKEEDYYTTHGGR